MMILATQLLTDGRAALQRGDKATAQALLTQLVEQDEHHEDGWLWLSAAVATPDDQRVCLQNVLHINPANRIAQQGLTELSATTPVSPDPDLPPAAPPTLAPTPPPIPPPTLSSTPPPAVLPAAAPVSLDGEHAPELRQYRIVKIFQDGTYEFERGKPRDFNHLISEGWEVDRVLNWTDIGGNLLFSRPRPAGYAPPDYRLPGHPFAGR